MGFLDTLLGRKNHLDFRSVEEWMESESVPASLSDIKDTGRREKLLTKMAELRKKLWQAHLDTLTADERAKIEKHRHPAQSWSRSAEAEEYLQAFRQSLASNQYIAEVRVDRYPCDRLVLAVMLKRNMMPSMYRKFVPNFFKGFEVRVAPTTGRRTN